MLAVQRLYLAGLILCLGLAVQAGQMKLYHEEVDLSEGGTGRRPVIETETHRVRFQAPAQWHLELTSTNQTVMFYEPGLGAGILMRLWTEGGGKTTENEWAGWRERIEKRLDQTELVGEFRAFGAQAQGLGIDLEEWLTPTTRAVYRIALIPFEGGLAEFELRTTATQATNYHRVFRHLVGSFSAERRSVAGAGNSIDGRGDRARVSTGGGTE